MSRAPLLKMLETYAAVWTQGSASWAREDEPSLIRLRNFVEATPGCFERTTLQGHVTGSALITSPRLDRVLLTHHRKLNLWLQLGGHSDGDPDTAQVALREAHEESGLKDLKFLAYEARVGAPAGASGLPNVWPLAFDLDCHTIPGRPKEPEHIHYDVRFLIVADPAEPLVVSEESNDLRWFTLAEAREVTAERSMVRQFEKLAWLRQVVDRGP